MPVTLITGTSRGIGKHLAERLLLFGHTVYGISRSEATIDHPRYGHSVGDIADADFVRATVGCIGKVDWLINNAGIASMNHTMLTPIETVRRIFETNVFGPYLLAQEAVRKKCRRIVNLSSIAVPLDLEGESAYAASKAAIESLTRIWAKEFSSFGCTVNAVGPGPVVTDLIKNVPSEKLKKLLLKTASGHCNEFKDIDNVIGFFLNDLSGMVTGQTIYLGGVS